MLPGVRPIISLASVPTESTLRVPLLPSLTATTEGSLQMMPRPRTYTSVFAVPRSIARSLDSIPASQLNMLRSLRG